MDEIAKVNLESEDLAAGCIEQLKTLLDESANHLDIGSADALGGFLSGFSNAFLLLTHDLVLANSLDALAWTIESVDLLVRHLRDRRLFWNAYQRNSMLRSHGRAIENRRERRRRDGSIDHCERRAAALR